MGKGWFSDFIMPGEIDESAGLLRSEEDFVALQERVDGVQRELERVHELRAFRERKTSLAYHLQQSDPVLIAYVQDYWSD